MKSSGRQPKSAAETAAHGLRKCAGPSRHKEHKSSVSVDFFRSGRSFNVIGNSVSIILRLVPDAPGNDAGSAASR